MKHHLNLHPEPFALIEEGKKTYELRLYDQKRRLIKNGDTIVFTDVSNQRQIEVLVKSLLVFPSFEELYHTLPSGAIGYREGEEPNFRDMEIYYPLERQRQYQVVAIEIELLS